MPTAVPLGIMLGLVIGKPLGIGVARWLAVGSGLATLPDGVNWRHLLGTAFLAGIGFTMALLISGLAFPGTPFENQAKLAILLGSLLAATVVIAVLLTTRPFEADSTCGCGRMPARCANPTAGSPSSRPPSHARA